MKTTLDLPDDLLIEAKAVAARRRTTLKAIVEHALRREIQPAQASSDDEDQFIEYDEKGIPGLKRRGVVVTSEMIYQMMENEEF
jgi:hypothetical protein